MVPPSVPASMATSDRPVLVTGSSTGIGRAIVELLAAEGHPVLAGARKESDLAGLGQLSGVTPVRLDVTRAADVGRLAAEIRASGHGLYGLVNNAGIGAIGPLAEIPVEELHRVFAVNLDGIHRLVGATFPFLRESRGRVVNISSISGILVEPFFGPYNISKHAVEAYTDTLREELAPLGLHVSAIEPGVFQSRIFANGLAAMPKDFQSAWEASDSVFRDTVLKILEYVSTPEMLYGTEKPVPTPVARAVADALYSDHPKPRYLVANPGASDLVVHRLLTLLRQCNEGQPHPLRPTELHAQLDRALREG